MLPTALIWFREVMEMALILGVVMAATRGIPARGRYVWAGVTGGLLGALLLAFFADALSEAAEGMGQELFNGAILLAASAMIGWTVVWMKKHGREVALRIKHVGEQVRKGERGMAAIAAVVAISMWREGAEIVLFMTGILATTQEPVLAIVAGGAMGAAGAGALGFALYFGLLRLSPGRMFTVTGWMLTLLAAGLSLQAAGFFSAAGLLPELVSSVWDSGALLPEASLPGRILHTLVGYSEQPSLMQLLWFAVTLAVICAMQRYARRGTPAPAATV